MRALRQARIARTATPTAPSREDEAAWLGADALARRGQHRVPIADLIISAAAHHANLVVLHHDRDFERIAAVGAAAHGWVVPPGSA